MQQPKMSWQEMFERAGGVVIGKPAGGGSGGSAGGGGTGGSGSSGSGGSGGGGKRPSAGSAGDWIPSSDQLSEKAKKTLKRALIICAIALIPVLLFCYWWFHPPINVQSSDAWVFVSIFILFPIFAVFYFRSTMFARGTAKHPKSAKKAKLNKRISYLPVIVVVIGLLGAVASSVIFPGNAEKYSTVLSIQTSNYAEDIKEVNYEEIPVVDKASAVLLGNRVMGGIPEFVSQFEISQISSQINYQGHPVRVSPLVYADFFKWWNNNANGLPAYVKVDMTTQDAQIVHLDEPMRFSESEPFDRNIDRYVQLSFPFYLLGEKSFEIDDSGNPWWIVPVEARTIGLFGGTTISRVILVNAVTGACQDLSVEEAPQWVDRVYPAELLVEQYNWYGAYNNGFINSFLGQEGVVQTTPGTNGGLGYNYIAKDDDVWLYSGVTSAVSDSSIVGFILINQRTAQSYYYAIAGATEDSAMHSAEGQVQHLGYQATFPLLLNINSQPTYFMALKDNAGLVKMYAMLDIQRYQNVAVGDTLAQCQSAYMAMLVTNGVDMPAVEESEVLFASGNVEKIATAVIDGNSHFYLKLTGDEKIYDCALPAVFDVLAVSVGDAVEVSYREGPQTNPVESVKVK